jgi:ATP-binding cassette, subfamily B, bacterial
MSIFRNIVLYFRHYWRIALLSIGAMSLFEIVDLFVPYAIGQILNVLSGQAIDRPLASFIAIVAGWTSQALTPNLSLVILIGLIFIISVGRAPIQPWIGNWFQWDVAFQARREHSRKSLEKVLTLPLEYYDENNAGRVSSRIAKGISNHTWSYPEITGQLIPKFFRVLGIFVMVSVIDWRIAGILLAFFSSVLTFSFWGLKNLAIQEKKLDKYVEDTDSRTAEIITNIKTVKAFATEGRELKRQKTRIDREFQILDYRIHKGYVQLGMYERTIVQTGTFLILALTLWATVQGRISLGHFVTILTISNMAFSEVEPICNLAEVFARRYASMARFHEFMALPAGRDAGNLVDQGLPPYEFTGKIQFNNVNFGYNADRLVLQNINLQIDPYQTVALVGRSGSGKSTLVKLLFRYFEVGHGSITIDGHDTRQLDITGYRRRLAIVHQEVDVFNGTIWDNLMYGNPDASPSEVYAACEVAQADGFIRQMPDGYGTMVGERGMRLSGGQRQRLGIARALIMNPDVLVFDEATSSLDYESERSIQVAMRSLIGTRTMIIIAHRLSTIREADKIVVLDQGRILEVGSHDQLLRREGLYSRLHSLQETGELIA